MNVRAIVFTLTLGAVLIFGAAISARHWSRPQAPKTTAYLGVQLLPLDPLGVRILAVSIDSPAEHAGLQVGDIIYAVNGQYVDGGALKDHLSHATNEHPLVLSVRREGQDHEIPVKVRVHTEPTLAQDGGRVQHSELRATGALLQGVYDDTQNGAWWILIDLPDESLLYAFGLRSGDRVVAVNQMPPSEENRYSLLSNLMFEDTVRLTILRTGSTHQLIVPTHAVQLLLVNTHLPATTY